MEITTQEQQLIEIIREQRGGEFSLLIERRGGAWDITLSSSMRDRKGRVKVGKAIGTGSSFDKAWDNMDPSWA